MAADRMVAKRMQLPLPLRLPPLLFLAASRVLNVEDFFKEGPQIHGPLQVSMFQHKIIHTWANHLAMRPRLFSV